MHQTRLLRSILEKEHPEVFEMVKIRIDEFSGKEFTEQNVIQAFFDFASKTKTDLTSVEWLKDIAFRRDLVAFMLLTFAPERIHGYTEICGAWGIGKELSLIIHVSERIIQRDINNVCDEFKIYKGFKNRCLDIFNKII